MDFSIVLPTYNEEDNIRELIPLISKFLNSYSHEIIVVDDDSSDGTRDAVNDLKKENNVRLIHRTKEKGLSTAVLRGFSEAKGKYLGVMDADLQHPPEKLPAFLKSLEEGYDVVVGSRYVEGGSLGDWSLFRKMEGKFAALLALPLTRVKDPMSGFFVLKKEVVEKVKLNPKGYKILLEILVKGDYKHVREVPFKFGVREKGESKLGFKVMLDYVKHLFFLYIYKFQRFIKFCFVGLSGVFVNMFFLWFFTSIVGLFYVLSGALAVEISIISNFLLNNFWTFKDRKKSKFFHKLIKFNLTCGVGLFINVSVLYLLTEFLGLWYIFSNVFGIISATLWNFLVSDKWGFKK